MNTREAELLSSVGTLEIEQGLGHLEFIADLSSDGNFQCWSPRHEQKMPESRSKILVSFKLSWVEGNSLNRHYCSLTLICVKQLRHNLYALSPFSERGNPPKSISQNSGNPDKELGQINACTQAHTSWFHLKAWACCQFACVLSWKISTLGLMRSKQWNSTLPLWLGKTSVFCVSWPVKSVY